jgi:hypothetical protein
VKRSLLMLGFLASACFAGQTPAWAGQAPGAASDPDIPVSHHDRVYSAEQFSNTVSVTDPADNRLVGVIRLGDPQPGNFSPLYRGQVLVLLGTWAPKHDFAGTVLVVAQDMFFAPDKSDDVKNVVADFRQVISTVDGMTIDREPAQVSVAGHPGYRIDFSGVGLFRSMFAIQIRCHVVTFNLTSRDPELLASLASSLDRLDSVRKETSDPVPECVKDYASENVVLRVEPHSVGTKAVSIPVRMIVATDGSVKQVHVIRASAAQRRNIEEAVRQWKFKPHVRQGHPVEVETGMVFNLKPANM